MRTTKHKQHSNYVVTRENGVFVARCPDLGLVCPGATEQEALANLEEALALYFEDLPGPADG
ncbi:MAG: type II toxin-antitoxin system HicB family antitoxin [Gallionella sp.]